MLLCACAAAFMHWSKRPAEWQCSLIPVAVLLTESLGLLCCCCVGRGRDTAWGDLISHIPLHQSEFLHQMSTLAWCTHPLCFSLLCFLTRGVICGVTRYHLTGVDWEAPCACVCLLEAHAYIRDPCMACMRLQGAVCH